MCPIQKLIVVTTAVSKLLSKTAVFSSIVFQCHSVRQVVEEITDGVAFHVGKDMVPIYVVEQSGFVRMLKIIEPKVDTQSHKYYTELALSCLYNEL